MPRTKGSRNRTTMSVDERIAAVTSEIEDLQEKVKEKKAQLKALKTEKAEEDQKRIMIAVLESGRSVDEVIELLKG